MVVLKLHRKDAATGWYPVERNSNNKAATEGWISVQWSLKNARYNLLGTTLL
jgi:hypothetical protein